MAQDMLGSTSRVQLQLIWPWRAAVAHPHAFTAFWIAFVLSSPVWLSLICNSGLSSFLTNLNCCLSCSSGSSPFLFPVSHLSLRTVPVCSLAHEMSLVVLWEVECCPPTELCDGFQESAAITLQHKTMLCVYPSCSLWNTDQLAQHCCTDEVLQLFGPQIIGLHSKTKPLSQIVLLENIFSWNYNYKISLLFTVSPGKWSMMFSCSLKNIPEIRSLVYKNAFLAKAAFVEKPSLMVDWE